MRGWDQRWRWNFTLGYMVYYLWALKIVAEDLCLTGSYDDDGYGNCLQCMPCPEDGWNSWRVPKCIIDNVTCQSVCRRPPKEWDNVAGEEICGLILLDLYKTTTQKMFTLSGTPHTTSNHPNGTIDNDGTHGPSGEPTRKPSVHLQKDRVIAIFTLVGVIIIIIILATLVRRLYMQKQNRRNICLRLVQQSATSFTVRVPKLHGDKKYALHVHREGKLIDRMPCQSGDHEFNLINGNDIYPNCKYDVSVRSENSAGVDENGGAVPLAAPLSFRTPGVTFALESGPTSITIIFQKLDININTITGCHCINNGEAIDVTDRPTYTIEGLLPDCKYIILYTTIVKDEPVKVGRQQIVTSAGAFDSRCTTTARQLLNDHQFKDGLAVLLTPHAQCQDGADQLRKNILKRARVCLDEANAIVAGAPSEDDFPDSWLKVENGGDFVDGYSIHLRHESMRYILAKSLFIEGVVDQSNKNQPQVKAFVSLLLKCHPGCLGCIEAIHKTVHEDGEFNDNPLLDNDSFNEASSEDISYDSKLGLV